MVSELLSHFLHYHVISKEESTKCASWEIMYDAIYAHEDNDSLSFNALHVGLMLGKKFSRRNFEIFFLFLFQKICFDISCKLSPKETICMKCQSLFSEKNNTDVVNLLFAGLAWRGIRVNVLKVCIWTP